MKWYYMTLGLGTAVILAVLLAPAQEMQDTMPLGSLNLRLGASEQEIRSRLPEHYTLEFSDPTPGSDVVTGKVFSRPGRLWRDYLGAVGFKRGVLISVSTDSGLGPRPEGVKFARELYSQIHGLTGGQERSCAVLTWQSQDIVNGQLKGITIRCGHGYVKVYVVHTDADESDAGIGEGIEE